MPTLSTVLPGLTYSDDTLNLQSQLNGLGFGPISIDGKYGPETKQAVMDFQYTMGGLTIDGIYGPETQAAMTQAIGMMNNDQWDAEYFPQKYGSVSNLPSIADEVRLPLQDIISTVEKTITDTGKTITASTGIDWKWIIIGVGVAIVIVSMMDEGKRKK